MRLCSWPACPPPPHVAPTPLRAGERAARTLSELETFVMPGYDVYVLGVQEGVTNSLYHKVETLTRCKRLVLPETHDRVIGRGDGSFVSPKFTGIAGVCVCVREPPVCLGRLPSSLCVRTRPSPLCLGTPNSLLSRPPPMVLPWPVLRLPRCGPPSPPPRSVRVGRSAAHGEAAVRGLSLLWEDGGVQGGRRGGHRHR
jgi:hypothetical protein